MTFGVDHEYQERVDRRRLVRIAVRLVVIVVILNVVVAVGSAIFAPMITGPGGSSFVTTEDGVAAWRELLGDLGRDTVASRERLDDLDLDPERTTLVVIQPDPGLLDGPYVRSAQRFVERGGQVVITAGNDAARALVPELGLENGSLGEVSPLLPVAETDGVRRAVFDSELFIADPGPGVPILSDDLRRHAAIAAEVGEGRVILLADKSAVSNRLLAVADNAALAVGVTGNQTVVFDEYLHGYGLEQGPASWPIAVQVAAGVILLGAIVWMWAAGRRLGPPEQPGRALPPARSDYINALGASLAQAPADEQAYGQLRRYGLDLLDRLAGPARAPASSVTGAARLTDDEIAALASPVSSKTDAVLVGSAVAKLQRSAVAEHQREESA